MTLSQCPFPSRKCLLQSSLWEVSVHIDKLLGTTAGPESISCGQSLHFPTKPIYLRETWKCGSRKSLLCQNIVNRPKNVKNTQDMHFKNSQAKKDILHDRAGWPRKDFVIARIGISFIPPTHYSWADVHHLLSS